MSESYINYTRDKYTRLTMYSNMWSIISITIDYSKEDCDFDKIYRDE